MKLFENSHTFGHNWEKVSIAHWVKYPHELVPHVTSVDYLSRTVDPVTGVLHTKRLLTCKQSIPDCLTKFFGGHSTLFILETSQVDPKEKTLEFKSNNVTLSDFITLEESCKYHPDFTDLSKTKMSQTAMITSFSGMKIIREQLESFGINRFQTNSVKGRTALEQVLDRLIQAAK